MAKTQAGTSDPATAQAAGGVPARGWLGVFTPLEHAGEAWHRRPLWGFILSFAASVIGSFTAFLGPSVVTLQLGPRQNLLPPWYLPVDLENQPNEWVVVGLGWLAVLLGCAGAVVLLRALNRGWLPDIKRLALFCLVMLLAACVVPPMTSADSLMYAAYGRIQLIGEDPYSITPAELFRQQWDPIVRWSERPWQDTPSVYGPVLMGSMWLANRLAGSNMHDVIFYFQLQTFLGMVISLGVLLRLAKGHRRVQARVLVLAGGHPMVWAVAVGAHNEPVVMAIVILALLFCRRSALLAGLAVGVACSGKATVGIYGLAFVWAYRRSPRKLLSFLFGAGVPTCIAYLWLYPQALELAIKNAGYLAGNSWAKPFALMLDPLLTPDRSQSLLSLLGWGLTIALCWMLSRLLPWKAAPGLPEGIDPRTDPLTIACRTAVTICAAWTISSLYSLPWYDYLTFLPLAIVGASMLDWILIWRVVMLNLAYVPGRVVIYSDAMRHWAIRGREQFAATGSALVIIAVILWWHRHGMRTGSLTAGPVPEGFENSPPPSLLESWRPRRDRDGRSESDASERVTEGSPT